MKKRILLIITIILIFIIILISTFQKNTYQGKITKIKNYNKRTIINLKNYSMDFVLFDNIRYLESCNSLKIEGEKNTYKNKSQIIINKIICLK